MCSKCKVFGHTITNCPKVKQQNNTNTNSAFANFHNLSAQPQQQRGNNRNTTASRPGLNSDMSWNDNNRNMTDLNNRTRSNSFLSE